MVASYFFALRTASLDHTVKEIAYHATSGVKNPPPGSLLAQCTAETAGVDAWDGAGRMGLLHVAFPLKMLLQPDGHLTSCDLLHTVAGAIIFDVYENQDARLVSLQIPERVMRTFPGPAYGPLELRRLAGFDAEEPAFGTILKPTAGITPDEVGQLVAVAAEWPLLLFVKEDEDLYPNLDYSPVAQRVCRAVAAIGRAHDKRQGRGLIFAPHITGAPHEIIETLHAVIEAGATGVMLSETFAGGTVRMVREATKHLPRPPAIYGHNAGIGVKTRGGIWRDVIDLLARLDGIDFRQTAPGAARPAVHPPLRRRMGGVRGDSFPRAAGNSADDDRAGRRPRPREHHSQPGRRRAPRHGGEHPLPGRLGDQFDQETPRAGPIRSSAPRLCSRRSTCIAPAELADVPHGRTICPRLAAIARGRQTDRVAKPCDSDTRRLCRPLHRTH